VRVNLTSRRSSVCSPGNIGVHSYRLSLESRHRRQEARCFNIEHAALLLREALQSSIVFVVSIYGINSILDARTGHAFAKIERGATRQAVISQLGKPDVTRPCGKNLWWGGDGDCLGRNDGVCVTEDRYEYFLSAWGVGYTADGRAVSKYHYFSE
jgi:hypothetical protein